MLCSLPIVNTQQDISDITRALRPYQKISGNYKATFAWVGNRTNVEYDYVGLNDLNPGRRKPKMKAQLNRSWPLLLKWYFFSAINSCNFQKENMSCSLSRKMVYLTCIRTPEIISSMFCVSTLNLQWYQKSYDHTKQIKYCTEFHHRIGNKHSLKIWSLRCTFGKTFNKWINVINQCHNLYLLIIY